MNLNRLMTLRKNNGWSLQYVSDQLGMAKSTYAGYESGYRRPSLEAITAMADLFETSVDYILGRVDEPVSFFGHTKKDKIEISDFAGAAFSVDGTILSEEDLLHLVAFVRAKREVEQTIRERKTIEKNAKE